MADANLGTFKKEDGIDTAEKCKQLCLKNPSCLSVEFYDSSPVECFVSTTCNTRTATAKLGDLDWRLTLYVRQKQLADKCPKDKYNDADNDGLCGNVDKCPLDPANDEDRFVGWQH